MSKHLALVIFLACVTTMSWSQSSEGPSEFEIYGLASGMRTVDASGTIVTQNPAPNQSLGCAPTGIASGVRTGFVWRHENVGLVADIGFHKYSDHTGSTSLAPLRAGVRIYSEERFRTSFFGEGFLGMYRWSVRSGSANFTTAKGIVSGGGGMDIRLTRHFLWRALEVQVAIAGAQNGPLLSGGPSTGIVYQFGRH